MTKKKAIVLAVGAIAFMGCVGVLGIAGFFYVSVQGISSREPTAEEKERLVHVSRLEPYGSAPPNPGPVETYRAQHNLDGSVSLEYEYDSDKDPGKERFLFFKSEAETNRSENAARESYDLSIGAYKVGVKLVKGRVIEPSNEPFGLGAESYTALIRQDGKPIGNIVVVRQGKAVHSLLVLGLYFEDPRDLRDLLRPGLEKAAQLDAK